MKQIITILLLCCFMRISTAQTNPHNFSVGTNITDVNSFGSQIMFKDLMKHAQQWTMINTATNNNVDSVFLNSEGKLVSVLRNAPNSALRPNDGYPLQSPFNFEGITAVARAFILDGGPHSLQNGEYELSFQGTGEVSVSSSSGVSFGANETALNSTSSADKIRFIYNDNNGESVIQLVILSSSANDPIRDIHIVPVQFLNDFQTQPFHPRFLEFLNPFTVIRFMDYMQTNNSPIVDFNNRCPLEYYSYTTRIGAPYELMIDLCNLTQKDPWICVPHQASDGYIFSLASMLRDRTNSNRKIYIEYSNEVWNPQFNALNFAMQQGQQFFNGVSEANSLGDISPNGRGLQFVAKRNCDMYGIFNQVFGAQMQSRVCKVLGAQASNPNTSAYPLAIIKTNNFQTNGQKPDVVAIAPYLGADNANVVPKETQLSESQILDSLDGQVNSFLIPFTKAHKAIADDNEIDLITYEGGQHLIPNEANIPKFLNVMKNPRMKDIYCKMLTAWKQESGGLFMHFTSMFRTGIFGCWGAVENMDEVFLNQPKYKALVECGVPSVTPPNCFVKATIAAPLGVDLCSGSKTLQITTSPNPCNGCTIVWLKDNVVTASLGTTSSITTSEVGRYKANVTFVCGDGSLKTVSSNEVELSKNIFLEMVLELDPPQSNSNDNFEVKATSSKVTKNPNTASLNLVIPAFGTKERTMFKNTTAALDSIKVKMLFNGIPIADTTNTDGTNNFFPDNFLVHARRAGSYQIELTTPTCVVITKPIVLTGGFVPPPPCTFDFTATPNNNVVTLTGITSGLTGCTVNWGDGTIDNTCTPAPHTYATSGQQTITFTVTGGANGCAANTVPKTVFTILPAVACAIDFIPNPNGATVTITGLTTGLVGCSINWGDGTTTDCNTLTHTYASSGTKTIIVSVTGGSNNCIANSASKTVAVTVPAIPCVFDFTPTANVNVVSLTNITAGLTGCTVNWGDGIIDNTCSPNPHTYTTAGTQTIVMAVTSGVGNCATNSLTKTVTVTLPCSAVTVSIANPVNKDVSAGNLIILTRENTNCLDCNLQWQRNGVDSAGKTQAILSTNITGTYRLKATNACGNFAFSNEVTLSCDAIPIAQLTQPPNSTISFGGTKILSTSVSSCNSCTFQWQKNGQNIVGETGTNLTATLSGTYTYTATNVCGNSSISNPVTLNDCPKPAVTLASNPVNALITTGQNTISLTASASNCNQCRFSWKKDNTPIAGSNPTITANAAGTFTVTATSDCGNFTESNAVIVTVCPTPIVTVTPPVSLVIPVGGSTTLTASVTNCDGCIFTWKKDGVNTGTNSNNLVVTAAGSYTVSVTNNCGNTAISNAVALITCPTISSTNIVIVNPANRVIAVGGAIALTATITNCTGCTVQWRKDNTDIAGATQNSFEASLAGNYTARVSNACGNSFTTIAPITLSTCVLPTVAITSPVTALTAGGSITLTAGVTNCTGCVFQWKKEGTNIGTNSITFAATAAGNYTCTVTNNCNGTATSNSITITACPAVAAIAKAANSPSFLNIAGTTNLQVTLVAGSTYEWKKNDVVVAGAISNTLSITTIGTYKVKAKNTCGNFSNEIVFNITACPAVVLDIVANATSASPVCINSNITVGTTFNSSDTYLWTLNNTSIANPNNNRLSTTKIGAYTIRGTNSCGNTKSVETNIKRFGVQARDLPVVLGVQNPLQPNQLANQKDRIPTYKESNKINAEFVINTLPADTIRLPLIPPNQISPGVVLNVQLMTGRAFKDNIIPVLLASTTSAKLSAIASDAITFSNPAVAQFRWKKDGAAFVALINRSSANIVQPGVYEVEVTLACGTVITNKIFVKN